MNSKLKKSLRPLLIASTLALCVVGPRTSAGAPPRAAQDGPAPDAPLVSYPPGAVAVFAGPIELREGEDTPAVYVARADAAGPAAEWVPSVQVVDAAEGAGKKLVAFVVPQLPRGRYLARYELRGRLDAKESMSLFIEPQLHAVRGVVEGTPDDVLKVEVGIDATFVAGKDGGEPLQRLAHITLQSDSPTVVDLAPGQPASVTTGENGTATSTWEVRLGKVGAATLTATAPGFESAEVRVIVMPPPTSPGALRLEKQAEDSEIRAARADDRVQRAQVDIDRTNAELVLLEQSVQADEVELLRKKRSLERAENSKAAAMSYEAEELTREAATETRLAAVAVAPGPPAPCSEIPLLPFDQLQTGDVLLMTGKKFISKPIILFERSNFRWAEYSHAALYVRADKLHMVIEVLGDGYNHHPLAKSLKDATRVDVYRWKGSLDDGQRYRIAYGGLRQSGKKYYAWPQIEFMAAATATGIKPETLNSLFEGIGGLKNSRGEQALTCSELVAWAYHHAGLDPSAANWWPALKGFIGDDDERRHDYTTPNMFADEAGKFRRVGRLVPRC